LLARATSYPIILVAAGFIGIGSSIFHPEASRLARLASGGRHGFAQSLFQVGGNCGSALGPLLAAAIVVPRGQPHIMWFSLLALAGIVVLTRVGAWYQRHLSDIRRNNVRHAAERAPFSTGRTVFILSILGVLLFSKFVYLTSFTSYYTFYLIEQFHVSVQHAQVYLFGFLFATAVGTILGGPIGDRFGRKIVIWFSILGVAPFSLILPHAGLVGCAVLSVLIGVVLASAFSVILVYAQELVPGKVGLIAGLFFGFAFGIAGIGSVLLGVLADYTSIFFVFELCAWLPLLGLLTVFLPKVESVSP
jgi:FSR family fosmidomycin resistance protein-like MFS transporter